MVRPPARLAKRPKGKPVPDQGRAYKVRGTTLLPGSFGPDSFAPGDDGIFYLAVRVTVHETGGVYSAGGAHFGPQLRSDFRRHRGPSGFHRPGLAADMRAVTRLRHRLCLNSVDRPPAMTAKANPSGKSCADSISLAGLCQSGASVDSASSSSLTAGAEVASGSSTKAESTARPATSSTV